MRVRSRTLAAVMAVALTSMTAAGCGGGADAEAGKVLTYWASQQSPSIERDKEILEPELAKFTEQTGIRVELEVIPFTDLLNRILTATTSGQGPDVLNIGNTWSPSLQATGALAEWDEEMLAQIGGANRFEPVTLETAGAEGQAPASVPLYTKVFQLYYNKQLFEDAGIDKPPATWDELVTAGKKLTQDTDGDGEPDQWGLGLRGQAFTTALHYAYILGSAHGAEFFTDGEPTFDSAEAVAGIDQLLAWMGEDGIVNPSDAENADWADVYEAFAKGRVGMMVVQTLGQTLKDYGLTDDDYGVAPVPTLTPDGGEVASFVGGTNVAVFENTDNMDSAVDLVEFLTSAPEQIALNRAYGTVPPVTDATDPAFETPEVEIALATLRSRSVPLPRVPEEAQFETLVGEAVVSWLADTATGDQPSEADISAELDALSERVEAGG